MPLGGFASNSVEKETILLRRALLEIEEISTHYGEDPENPAPFEVKDENGEVRFTSSPYVNALVKIVDDYGDGTHDGKQFYDKFYLSKQKDSDTWMVGAKGKLGRIFKTHPKYGDKCFEDPTTVYVEQDLVHHQFEAETEQREDKNGTKLPGTRINYETIGPVPNRDKKKRAQEIQSAIASMPSETEIHSKAVEAVKAKRAEAGVPLTEAQVREMNASIYQISMICPFCKCDDSCGREQGLYLPRLNRSIEVFAAVSEMYSKDRSGVDTYPLHRSQHFVLFGYFPKHHPPRLVDVGNAQDLIREVER